MFKVALLVWIVLGATLAGMALTLTLTIPAFQANAMKLLPIFSLAGFVVAIPASWFVAKKILEVTKGV
ncbi:hypothetical protein [Pinisolibacter aquiterrae]|jgi:hypothetical protein|uniref:hypothetical protein n=1 Tax=Pinisolibacter aquiterrae TaxID=2815579 RepID=UPI001C3D4979|nr:hypothetical protein [Pinisolibacter aquiterrae]MBV5266257.1 hypothetical protein [Pinisolibacter aquiterrae]MCC8236345.1 hypothetical protein [Pinisolibacter aquiterrae]